MRIREQSFRMAVIVTALAAMWPTFAAFQPQFYRQVRTLRCNRLKYFANIRHPFSLKIENSFLVLQRILPQFQRLRVLLFPNKKPERRILTVANKTQYHGGLIYYGTPSSALAKCSCIIADTLEEYGHSVDQFSARSGDVIALACDQYRLVLRMGDQPTTLDNARAGSQRVEISLQPIFPSYCDSELSEMLMAIMLYRLVPVLGAEHVEWMDSKATLTRSQFLGVFAKIRPMRAQPQTSGQARFASIEETAVELDLHCVEMQKTRRRPPAPVTKPASYQRLTSWAEGLMRGKEHNLVSLAPPLVACTALLLSSGVV